jgi:hypothetical protein
MIVGHLRRKPNLWPFTIVSKGETVSGVDVLQVLGADLAGVCYKGKDLTAQTRLDHSGP